VIVKATSEFVVTAPAHYQVVSNGLLVEETDLPGGQPRTSWRQSVPIATWLNALGVARFAVRQDGMAHGIPVQTWVFAEERDAGFLDFPGPTRDVVEFFSETTGSIRAVLRLHNARSQSLLVSPSPFDRMSEGAVRVAVHRRRRRFGKLVRREITQTVSSSVEIDDQLRHLWSSVSPLTCVCNVHNRLL
jgi:hypothetical protein